MKVIFSKYAKLELEEAVHFYAGWSALSGSRINNNQRGHRMNQQKQYNKEQQSDQQEKPLYSKPEVIATYSKEQLEKKFTHVYGGSSVDLFG